MGRAIVLIPHCNHHIMGFILIPRAGPQRGVGGITHTLLRVLAPRRRAEGSDAITEPLFVVGFYASSLQSKGFIGFEQMPSSDADFYQDKADENMFLLRKRDNETSFQI